MSVPPLRVPGPGDGTPEEVVTFALDGTTYELDLTRGDAATLRALLQPYAFAGRRVGGKALRFRAYQAPPEAALRRERVAPATSDPAAEAVPWWVVGGPAAEPAAAPARPRRRAPSSARRTVTRRDPEQTKAIRAWALARGYQLPPRGKIPDDVIAAFDAAGT